jgi:transposase-like protein
MSLRGIPLALSAFNVQISHMTVWRGLQEQTDMLRKRRHWQKVSVLGLDGAYPLIKGRNQPTLIAVDLGNIPQPLMLQTRSRKVIDKTIFGAIMY